MRACERCGSLERVGNGRDRRCVCILNTVCGRCGVLDRYPTNGRCRPCNRAAAAQCNPSPNRQLNGRRHAAKKRGWAAGQFELSERLRPSATECACCRYRAPRTRNGWQADHDHLTGIFRGFLCLPCNIRIGIAEKHALALSADEAAYLGRERQITE